jgi:opacity protein-like surface antigen
MAYASTGTMVEVNLAGEEKTESFLGSTHTDVTHANVRMKEWQWSVNARAGISYPIFRPISVFAEIGVSYYFDNGSEMETIYSDKSFNLSPQLGFRLSF